MERLAVTVGLLIPPTALIVTGAVALKFLWWITGMGEWISIGPLPWGPAFFVSIVLHATADGIELARMILAFWRG